jgi:hypothetical protein
LLVWLILAAPVQAATLTFMWDPPLTGDTPTGYQLLYGTAPGTYDHTVDVGPATTVAITNLLPATRYFAVAKAYNAEGIGPPSNEVTILTSGQDAACEPPLGDKSISLFPTKLTTTGSGGAGSKFRVDFQAASSTPILRLALRANGADIATMNGLNLNALAGMWATVPTPPGTYVFSIVADNQYGCHLERMTSFVIVVKP